MKEKRLKVANSPHNSKLKPWTRAKVYNAPTSSDEDDRVETFKKKDAYYPATPRRSVKLSEPLKPKPELQGDDGELSELVLVDEKPVYGGMKGKVVMTKPGVDGVVDKGAVRVGEANGVVKGEARIETESKEAYDALKKKYKGKLAKRVERK